MQQGKIINKTRIFLSGKVIDEHIDEVRRRNCEYLRAFSLCGLAVMALIVIFGQIMGGRVAFNTEFLILLGYFAVMTAVSYGGKINIRRVVASMYLWMTPIMAIGVLLGTFLDPGRQSVTIMVFLCVIPLLVFDKPWRIISFIIIWAVIYAACCYASKTRELFASDMINLVLFYILSIGVNCLMLRDRMRNVEYAFSIRKASETDALTSIFNRGAGERNIISLISQRQYGMLCVLDIDGFKIINDQYGHINGDEVLKSVANQLCASFRAGDIVTRMGGDEFAVYAVGIRDIMSGTICIERLFSRIRDMAEDGIEWDRVSISLGATFFGPGDEKDFRTLYRESDKALYHAKRCGKGQYFFYEARETDKALISK